MATKRSLTEQRKLGAKDVAQFDREMVIEEFRPLSAAGRARWEAARRKPGRPRHGEGSKIISISVERELLEHSDSLAKTLGITRSNLIARGLKAVLVAVGGR